MHSSLKNNQYIGKIVSNQDITKRKELEMKLAKTMKSLEEEHEINSRYKYHLATKNNLTLSSILKHQTWELIQKIIIEAFDEGTVIFQGKKIIQHNTMFLQLFGYKEEEIPHLSLCFLIPVSFIASEEFYQNPDKMGKSNNERVNYTFIAEYIRKDGTIFVASVNMSRIRINELNALIVRIKEKDY